MGICQTKQIATRHAVWKTPFTENPGRRINLISVKTVSKHVTHSSNPLDSSCLILWQYSRQYQLHRMITLSSTPSSLPTSSPSSALTVTTLPFPAITTTSLPSHHHPPFPAITTTSLRTHHYPLSPSSLLPSSLLPPHHLPLSVNFSYWLSLTRSPAACRPH